jgi:hypothetical protein
MVMIASRVWWPSTNPLGAQSVTAVVVSAAAWFLVDRHILPSERAQGWVTIIAPLLLLGLVFYSKVHADTFGVRYGWRDWRYHPPDAQNYFADFIFVAVALVLARKAACLRA